MRTDAPPTAFPRRRALCVALTACLAVSCHRSSPTAPVAESPPRAAVVFLDSELAEHEQSIRTLIANTVERANGPLDVDPLRFTLAADRSRAIPGWGLGGYTLGPGEVEIVVDPAYGNLGTILEVRLAPIVAHEIHHTVRWRSPGPYGTLLDAFVFEGLADHFAIELLGADVPPWSRALSPGQIERYLERSKSELDSFGFDFEAWFFGVGSDLPRWTGYSLGFHLVDRFLAEHPGRSAADLVHEPSDSFRPD